jgi:hypothetical protein
MIEMMGMLAMLVTMLSTDETWSAQLTHARAALRCQADTATNNMVSVFYDGWNCGIAMSL